MGAVSSDPGALSHYEVLGVERDADDKAIRVAYSAAVWAARADDDDERERAVQQARAALGDPERRAAYDATLPPVEEPVRQPSGEPALASLLAMLAETGRLSDDPSATEDSGDEADDDAAEVAAEARQPDDADDAHDDGPESDETDGEEGEPEEPVSDQAATVDRSALPPGPVPEWAAPAPAGPVRPRRGRKVAVLALVLSAVAGAGLGWFYLQGQPALVLEEGSCVTLGEAEATAVSCQDDRADARMLTVTDDPQGCDGDAGHVVLDGGRVGCLTYIEASPPTGEG